MGLFSDKKYVSKPPAPRESASPQHFDGQQTDHHHRNMDMKNSSQTHEPLLAQSTDLPSAVIGSKILFKGELTGEEDLLVQGKIEGTISLTGFKLTIGKLGSVKADIRAKNIVIDGTVEGDIIADEHIAINASSVVKGNVIAQRVTLEDGAKFRGSIDMETDLPTAANSSSKPVSVKRTELEPA